jgi:tetratricopeptide (TPR) repeat protein
VTIRILAAALVAVSLSAQTTQQPTPPAPQHEANFDAERKQANDLFTADKILESLPLYEDLCRQDQTIAVFAERHGTGLLKKSATIDDPQASKAMHDEGMKELRRALALGDNSLYVQNILSLQGKSLISTAMTGIPLSIGYLYRGTPEAQAVMKEAESAFGHDDIAGALKLYQRTYALDPKWYSAALFTGDMYFRLKDSANAGIWFQKAIDIDPNRETAYRYWGDALFKSGARDAAKAQYEGSIVAEPYAKQGWIALQQWSTLMKVPLRVPQIALPKYTAKDGVLDPDPALQTDAAKSSGRAAWIAYETCRVKHAAKTNTTGFSVGADGSTKPTGYYHSLVEESECLRATLADLRGRLLDGSVTTQTLDPSLQALDALDRAGVLECWILLNSGEQGVGFDYPAYRNAHRAELIAYIDRYLIQPAQQ